MVNAMEKYALIMQDTYVLDYRILHRDGTIQWLHEQGHGIFGGERNPLYLDDAVFDITDPMESIYNHRAHPSRNWI